MNVQESLKTLPAMLAGAVASNGDIPRVPYQPPAAAAAEAGLDGPLQWSSASWVRLLSVGDVPANSGASAMYGKTQIAVYNFAARGQWFASHAMCPHKNSFVMNQGLLGDAAGVPKVGPHTPALHACITRIMQRSQLLALGCSCKFVYVAAYGANGNPTGTKRKEQRTTAQLPVHPYGFPRPHILV